MGVLRNILIVVILFCSSPAIAAIPSSLDWRNVDGVNYVTSVKDQGSCGDCWAFATTAALESQLLIHFRLSADLSEQTLLSCSGAGNCTSGSKTSASSYIRNTGLPLETCFAYTGTQTPCSSACSTYQTNVWKITGYETTNYPSVATIKEKIYTYGPVIADMRMYDDFFHNYTGGIYTYDGVSGFHTGHDVLVVGYNDAESYFICKNTRGSSWGESGYFRIAYSETYAEGGTTQFGTQIIAYLNATNRIFYVDYASGSDDSNGLSTSAPFKHCPGDNYATGVAKSTTLSGGDRVIFKGGVTYMYEGSGTGSIIDLDWAGSGDDDSQRIIYDGDSGNYVTRWASGTAKAIIDGNEKATTHFYFPGARSYITINNFVLRKGNESTTSGGHLIRNETKGSNYITVSNCDMSDAGVIEIPEPCVDNPANTCGRGSGMCVGNQSGDYWKVHDNTFTDCGTKGVSMYGGNHNEIYNNTLTGRIGWMVELSTGDADVGALTDFSIHNNVFYDHMYSNKCAAPPHCYPTAETHGNWLYVYGANCRLASLNNVKIYNNKFYHSMTVTQTLGYSTGFIHFAANTNQQWNGAYIFNNVFFNPEMTAITLGTRVYPACPDNGYITNVYILNNTLYNNVASTGAFRVGTYGPTSDHFTNLYIRNNVIWTSQFATQIPLRSNMSGNVEIDYNNYYDTWSANCFRECNSIGSPEVCYSHPWSGTNSWTTTLGYDANAKGPTSDPLFVDTTVGHNFNLRFRSTSSPAYNTGANLTSLCSNPNLPQLCYDKDGIPRPRSGAWDMGAYQFTGAPLPPSNLKIIQ